MKFLGCWQVNSYLLFMNGWKEVVYKMGNDRRSDNDDYLDGKIAKPNLQYFEETHNNITVS